MNKKKEQTTTNKNRNGVSRSIMDLLNGSFLTKDKFLQHLPYLLFVTLLTVFYIGYGYHAEKTVRELYKVDKKLKELKSESTTAQMKLEIVKQQSHVADAIREIGLEESTTPPKKIIADKALLKKRPQKKSRE